MDDVTMKIGLLMEAAQANQRAADSSLKKLKAATNEIATSVKEDVHRALTEELRLVSAETRRALESLQQVRRAAALRILVWSVGITALCSAIPLGLACWMIPSQAEIASLRGRHDRLALQIANLEERGARIDLRRCGEHGRLCVRVDRKAPQYGDQSDYLIVRGY